MKNTQLVKLILTAYTVATIFVFTCPDSLQFALINKQHHLTAILICELYCHLTALAPNMLCMLLVIIGHMHKQYEPARSRQLVFSSCMMKLTLKNLSILLASPSCLSKHTHPK